jgi:hypothetical protein
MNFQKPKKKLEEDNLENPAVLVKNPKYLKLEKKH